MAVFLRRWGDARARYAEVAVLADDEPVARLASRAAQALGRGASAAYVDLFLVRAGGVDEPTAAEERAALERPRLQVGWPLRAAGLAPGAWLLACVAEPPPAAPPAALPEPAPLVTLESLLLESRVRPADIDARAVMRTRLKYGHLVALALLERNPALAREAYELGVRLPSTTTVDGLRVDGYQLDGPLHDGSELVVCFKHERAHLLKGLRGDEAARAHAFHAALAGSSVPHLTPFELLSSAGGRCFMLMPKFATALEPVPHLSPAGCATLWAHVHAALECLHAMGFAHSDVKPANICITEDGGAFVLVDLGSVARFGDATSSTDAYVPRGQARGRASAALDWWMLAMTLAEKACGPEHALEVGGAHHADADGLRAHLGAHLAPDLWAALEPKLQLPGK